MEPQTFGHSGDQEESQRTVKQQRSSVPSDGWEIGTIRFGNGFSSHPRSLFRHVVLSLSHRSSPAGPVPPIGFRSASPRPHLISAYPDTFEVDALMNEATFTAIGHNQRAHGDQHIGCPLHRSDHIWSGHRTPQVTAVSGAMRSATSPHRLRSSRAVAAKSAGVPPIGSATSSSMESPSISWRWRPW
jgi:hypothetical protein